MLRFWRLSTIEYLGFIYGMIKDLKKYFQYEEDELEVDNEYLEILKKKHKDKGENVEFHVSNRERVQAGLTKGWDYYYKIDDNKRKKYILKFKNGQIILAKFNK